MRRVWSLNRCEIGSTIVDIAFMFYFVFFLVPLFSVLSFLPRDSLWLVEEGLTLLCFLIVRMEISCFLWEIFQSRFIMIPFISSRTGKVFIFHLVPNPSLGTRSILCICVGFGIQFWLEIGNHLRIISRDVAGLTKVFRLIQVINCRSVEVRRPIHPFLQHNLEVKSHPILQ